MRKKFFAALAASALVAISITGSALADTATYSKAFFGSTYTCEITYVDSDGLAGISSYDELTSITAVSCVKS